MSSYLFTSTVSTLEHTFQPLGAGSAQLRLSRQAAERFAQTRAAAERRAGASCPSGEGSLLRRARAALSRPRPA
jgi:hypothetical protein